MVQTCPTLPKHGPHIQHCPNFATIIQHSDGPSQDFSKNFKIKFQNKYKQQYSRNSKNFTLLWPKQRPHMVHLINSS